MFKNKIVFITGASSGLGRALAIELAGKNSTLALMSRNREGLEETALRCKSTPLLLQGDVTSETDCQNAINKIIEQYGRLDYLILNAGISMCSSFEELMGLSDIHQLIQTNYLGAVNCVYYALPHLKKTQGLITVISSIQGKIGVPYHSGYAASKHALEGFFNSLRMELNNQIDILMVSPGWIQGTELKQRALGKPIESNVKRNTMNQTKQALSLEVCCNAIIDAMLKRKRELVLPKHYYLVPWLKLVAPVWLDRLIQRKLHNRSTR